MRGVWGRRLSVSRTANITQLSPAPVQVVDDHALHRAVIQYSQTTGIGAHE
jgi:hypothetical protein